MSFIHYQSIDRPPTNQFDSTVRIRHLTIQTYLPAMANYMRSAVSYMGAQFDNKVADQDARERFYRNAVVFSRHQPFLAVRGHRRRRYIVVAVARCCLPSVVEWYWILV
jgi:hypothetical protein